MRKHKLRWWIYLSQKKSEIKSWANLIKTLFADNNWYLGVFIVLLILFIIFDLIAFTPHS
ncbi:conserved hypothetical protein [Sulfolobus islandicus Y.G.57.14]|jgi:hypothetical protein|uniref:Uncharacterized protein n=7 Tax=Saccharolobus islandicus TaxID=43080 RepID=C3MJC1_SACI2|nr:hypothetical protein [Sulfolobus islandicus]ACP34199.1 conserved hypothetical protein [Sulfolobus islandicus L.S.2.15]ACP36937.1 conserved hypothetical protein [Sulfolobus islandicus M.14.25]ACP44339.1 conserved hypothetical protein [Sulfolobus islandicus Y.G.57.14]ACP47244.1 hypothetical protein YN1551_0045 [Sulfolobus islandicus Y.N.15.51]ACP54074.1 hypothetical protein M1627_0045 [Sulfolobus islandicus M.16.27]